MTENEISYLVRGVIYKVHKIIGPGVLESVYEPIMAYELRKLGLEVKCQVALPFQYENMTFDNGYRMDLVINNKVIIEIKSVEALHEVHHKQVLTYLKLSKMKL